MTRAILVAVVALLSAPLAPALADDDYGHARDHREHYRFHDDVGEAHERAHDEGFDSRREHRAFHRGLRYLHGEFHADHPKTRHDHYRWWRRYW